MLTITPYNFPLLRDSFIYQYKKLKASESLTTTEQTNIRNLCNYLNKKPKNSDIVDHFTDSYFSLLQRLFFDLENSLSEMSKDSKLRTVENDYDPEFIPLINLQKMFIKLVQTKYDSAFIHKFHHVPIKNRSSHKYLGFYGIAPKYQKLTKRGWNTSLIPILKICILIERRKDYETVQMS